MADNSLNSKVVKLIFSSFIFVYSLLSYDRITLFFGTQRVINICIARVSFKRTIFFIQPKALNFTCLLLRNAKVLNILYHIDLKKIKNGYAFWAFKIYMQMNIDYFIWSTGLRNVERGHFVFSNNKPKPSTIDGIPSYLKLCLLLIMS